MAVTTNGTGADMKQATGTYEKFLTLLKVLIGVSIFALLILIVVYNV